jgi:hypothetical protein
VIEIHRFLYCEKPKLVKPEDHDEDDSGGPECEPAGVRANVS